MRSVVRNSVTCFAMFILTVATAFANDPYLKVEKTDDKVITFTAANVESPINISFKDAEGSILYSEKYNLDKAASKRYNLEEIVSGKYYLEIETDVKVEMYLIVVDAKTAEIREEAKKVLHKPVVVLKDNDKVMVTKLNLSKSDLNISVIDKFGNQIYSDKVDAETEDYTIGEKFDFSGVKKEAYTFYLTTDKRTYTETINL